MSKGGFCIHAINARVKARTSQIWLLCVKAVSRMPVISILHSNKQVEALIVGALKTENNVGLILEPGK